MNYNIEIQEFISSTHPNFWKSFNEYTEKDGRFFKVFKRLYNNKETNTNKNIEYVFFDLEEKGAKGSEYYDQITNNISYAFNLNICGIGENLVCAHYNLNKQIL